MNEQKFKLWDIGSEASSSLVVSNAHENTIYTEHDLVKLKEDYNNTLYQKNTTTTKSKKGNIFKLDDANYVINLLEQADLSTILHELGHFFFWEMQDAVRMGIADETLTQDLNTLKKWLKMEEWEDFTIEGTKGDTQQAKKKHK